MNVETVLGTLVTGSTVKYPLPMSVAATKVIFETLVVWRPKVTVCDPPTEVVVVYFFSTDEELPPPAPPPPPPELLLAALTTKLSVPCAVRPTGSVAIQVAVFVPAVLVLGMLIEVDVVPPNESELSEVVHVHEGVSSTSTSGQESCVTVGAVLSTVK